MKDRWKRRRLVRRAGALCVVLALLWSCGMPVFAQGAAQSTETVQAAAAEPAPDTEGLLPPEPEEPQPAEPEPETEGATDPEPEQPGPDSPEKTDEPASLPQGPAEDAEEYFETCYTFWLSEAEEEQGGLPYAEQTVGSGGELLLPPEPEAPGRVFRFWYSRGPEGEAVRFVPPEGAAYPSRDGRCSLYACFASEEQELPRQEYEPEQTLPEQDEAEAALPEQEEEEAPPEQTGAEPADQTALEAPGWGPGPEDAAVFLLKTPTCLPGSNDPSQWAPDNSDCRWIGRVDTRGAVWSDGGRNITQDAAGAVLSWPDGTTGRAWTLSPGDSYWDAVVDEIWEEYRDTIEQATGIGQLEKTDLESLTVTPYKISRWNNTTPDKHIDCTISVRSKKSFTARFNLRTPGQEEYATVDSREYPSGQRVQMTGADIPRQITAGGALYVFDGWYAEESGPAEDAPGDTQVTQDQWEQGYLPTDHELENGVVNFYAHYVLAHIDPDTGVRTEFFALPLVLGTAAAALSRAGGRKGKKEDTR